MASKKEINDSHVQAHKTYENYCIVDRGFIIILVDVYISFFVYYITVISKKKCIRIFL